jgi:hypothetical protein
LLLEIQIKFQKTRFWKEKSLEDVVTLGPMEHATLVAKVWHDLYNSMVNFWMIGIWEHGKLTNENK